MSKDEIIQILRLQQSAYDLLLWLNKRAEYDQSILSDQNLEKWRFASSCEIWLRDIQGMIPPSFRPATEEIPAFARLFSSFFQTSFYLTESAPKVAHDYYGHKSGYIGSGKRKLMAGSPQGKKSVQGKARVNETVRALRLAALEELALENELFPSRDAVMHLEAKASVEDALTLWTYVRELQRRAKFASQGEAVRALWLAMDKAEREKLSVELVIQVRDYLVSALRNCH